MAKQKPIYNDEMKHKVESKHGGFHRGESNYSEAEGKNSTEAANAIGVEKTPVFYTIISNE